MYLITITLKSGREVSSREKTNLYTQNMLTRLFADERMPISELSAVEQAERAIRIVEKDGSNVILNPVTKTEMIIQLTE